jgi:hypothetical protein
MANDNHDALTTGVLFLGGGAAGYAAGRWIVARWLDNKGAPSTATPATATTPRAALPPATASPPSAPSAPALSPAPAPAPTAQPRPASGPAPVKPSQTAPRPKQPDGPITSPSQVDSGPITSPSQVGLHDSSSGRPGRYPPAVERWRPLVTELANGINVDFLLTWIQHESGGNPCATGIANKETGLFQSYHPHDDRHGATFAELRAACLPGKQTADRPFTDAERRLQVSAGIALARACMKTATSTLQAIGAQWSTRDRYCLTKLVHALPSYAYRFPRAYAARYGRPPASWTELRAWVRSLSEDEAIAIDRAVRPWASVAQRDRLFNNAERTGDAVSQDPPRQMVAEGSRAPGASDALAWSASRVARLTTDSTTSRRAAHTPS